MTLHAFNQEDPTLAGLQSVAGNQNAPSPTQGPPPEGALGAPASAGGNSPPLAGGQTYFDMWNEASDEDQAATVEEMETQLGSQGTGIIAKTDEIASNAMAEKDGKTLNLLLKWGWKPPEERPAFDPSMMEADPSGKVEGALGGEGELPIIGPEAQGGEVAAFSGGEPEAEVGPPEGSNDEQEAHAKKMFNRRKMGGFLMELGLNILASNRDDAGAAVGDAFNQTRSARDARKRTRAAESLATSERERTNRRQDEADLHKRNAEDRAVRKAEIDEAKEGDRIDKVEMDKLDTYTRKDGTVVKINREAGTVYDTDGTPLKPRDASQIISATSEAASTRDKAGALRKRVADLITMASEGFEGDPGYDEIAALGEKPSQESLENLAKSQLNREMPGYYNFKVPETKDYDTLAY